MDKCKPLSGGGADADASFTVEKLRQLSGRVLHSSTSQLNMSRFCHKTHLDQPLILLNTP